MTNLDHVQQDTSMNSAKEIEQSISGDIIEFAGLMVDVETGEIISGPSDEMSTDDLAEKLCKVMAALGGKRKTAEATLLASERDINNLESAALDKLNEDFSYQMAKAIRARSSAIIDSTRKAKESILLRHSFVLEAYVTNMMASHATNGQFVDFPFGRLGFRAVPDKMEIDNMPELVRLIEESGDENLMAFIKKEVGKKDAKSVVKALGVSFDVAHVVHGVNKIYFDE